MNSKEKAQPISTSILSSYLRHSHTINDGKHVPKIKLTSHFSGVTSRIIRLDQG